MGSGGTAMGIKKYIAEHGLDCKVFALEPAESPLMSEGRAGAHLIQGIGANFIPALVDISAFDGILTVRGEDAVKEVGALCRTHGLKCGISSAAAVLGARMLRKKMQGDILAILPDRSDRYPAALYR